MSAAFERGSVLLNQNRYDLAAAEFRRALAEEPEDALAHALLGLCLQHAGKDDEAMLEVDEAVRHAPDLAFCHYARGMVLFSADRYKEAEAAAGEAIGLDPDEATFRGLLARIGIARKRWAEALEAADAGLALDPTDDVCLNVRGMALVQLGRREEARNTLGSSLADDPENAWTHANQGWLYLHERQPKLALEHFREALRLDPEMEWARQGVVESLKARHLIYRWMLAFFLRMARMGNAAQWAVILGFLFGRNALASVARSYPAFKPFIVPILALMFGFFVLTWIASPLFNFALRFNKFGRMALSPEERVESTWIGVPFMLAALSTLAYLATDGVLPLYTAVFFGFLLFPLRMVFLQEAGTPRRLAAAYTAAVALLAMPTFSVILMGQASPFANNIDGAIGYFEYFTWGCILSTWAANLIASRFSS